MSNLPKHVAIIPDGNRRWAKKNNLPTFYGHQKGFENSNRLVKKARELGVKVLTFWAFSTENWQRSEEEVGYLMKLFSQMIDKNLEMALEEKVRIIHLGRKERIPKELAEKIIQAEKETANFDKYFLAIALDYGGRDELLRAIKRFKDSNFKTQDLSEENFNQFLDTKDLPYPNPDLIIRTSGEVRTSGFMLWQGAYSEWIFSPKYFPEFTPQDLQTCIDEYTKRQRRFGR